MKNVRQTGNSLRMRRFQIFPRLRGPCTRRHYTSQYIYINFASYFDRNLSSHGKIPSLMRSAGDESTYSHINHFDKRHTRTFLRRMAIFRRFLPRFFRGLCPAELPSKWRGGVWEKGPTAVLEIADFFS